MLKQTPKKRVLFVRRITPALLALFGVFCFVTLNLRATPVANAIGGRAAQNNTINFQARLQTAAGAIVADGSYNVEFKLYTVSSGGSAIWTEDYLNSASQGVSTVNGYFSTSLGSISAFSSTINWDQPLWLTMNIGGSGSSASWDGEMNPRLQLTAVPYAFEAGQLAQSDSTDTNRSTLSIQAPTNGNQTFVIQDQGAAGTYNLLTTNQANNNYIKLQGSGPSPQTGNLSITGIGTFNGGINIGLANSSDGSLQLSNKNSSFSASIQATGVTSSYVMNLPTAIGSANQCLQVGSIASTTETLGYKNCASTLQDAYTNSGSNATIQLNGTTKGIVIQDAATPVGGNLLAVTDNAGTSRYLTVSASGTGINGALSVSGGTTTLQATSTNAFQVQNGSSQSLLNVDTINNTITLLGNAPAKLGTWATTTALPSTAGNYPNGVIGQGSAVYNGYAYLVGGYDGTTYFNKSYYAKLNADGTMGNWTAGTTLPSGAGSYRGMTTVVNGYLYYIGGYDGTNSLGKVSYARINSDGSLGSWQSGTALTGGALRSSSGVASANGYIYIVGGYDNTTTTQSVMYAKVNADGSLGAWTNVSSALAVATYRPSVAIANGYMYVMGGSTSTTASTATSDYYYASLNASTGAPGSFTRVTGGLPAADALAAATIANGYVYLVGGTANGTTATRSLYYAPISLAGGALGTWVDATSGNSSAPVVSDTTVISYNGYIYQIGGNSAVSPTVTGQTAVYYASVGRVQVGGSLDLVGLQNSNTSGNTSNGGIGGSLTAGNGTFVGSLTVQGQASFGQSVALSGPLSVGSVFAVDPSSEKITIGPAGGDTTGAILVLGNRTASGDPAEVDGAMYYNSNVNSFRCGESGIWVSCIGGLLTSATGISSTVTNTTTETPFSKTYSVPANYCANGRTMRMTAYGFYDAINGSMVTIRIKLGSTTLATNLTPGGNFSVETGPNNGWTLSFLIICPNAPGASATISGQGLLNYAGDADQPIPYTVTNTVNTSTAQTLSITAQWDTANTGNSTTLQSLVLEGLGP